VPLRIRQALQELLPQIWKLRRLRSSSLRKIGVRRCIRAALPSRNFDVRQRSQCGVHHHRGLGYSFYASGCDSNSHWHATALLLGCTRVERNLVHHRNVAQWQSKQLITAVSRVRLPLLQRPVKSLPVRPQGWGSNPPWMPDASSPRGASLATEAPQRFLFALMQVSGCSCASVRPQHSGSLPIAITSQRVPRLCASMLGVFPVRRRRQLKRRSYQEARAMTAVLASAKDTMNAVPVR
jgi:hypothetical protein